MDFLDYPREDRYQFEIREAQFPAALTVDESDPIIEEMIKAVEDADQDKTGDLFSRVKNFIELPDEEVMIYLLIGFILGYICSYLFRWICACCCCRRDSRRDVQIYPEVPLPQANGASDEEAYPQRPTRNTGGMSMLYEVGQTKRIKTKEHDYHHKYMKPDSRPPSSPKILHQHQLIKHGAGGYGFSHHGANPSSLISGEILSPSAPPVLESMVYPGIHGGENNTPYVSSNGFGRDGRWNGSAA